MHAHSAAKWFFFLTHAELRRKPPFSPLTVEVRAVAFLEGVSSALAETKQPRLDQPVLFLHMHMAQYQLAAGNVDACKAAVSGAKDELDRLHDVRPRTSPSRLPHAWKVLRSPVSAIGCFASLG